MSTGQAQKTSAARAGAGVLAATCVSTLVVNANTSAVTILLPAISTDVGASTATLQWAVTGYSLVGAAVIVTGGVLGDIAGRRRVFVAALLLFIGSCVVIALAGSGAGVIAGRALQGAAGSTILACGLSPRYRQPRAGGRSGDQRGTPRETEIHHVATFVRPCCRTRMTATTPAATIAPVAIVM